MTKLATERIPKDIINYKSVIGIATRYGTGRSGDRILVEARILATVQTDSVAHPASCTVGTGSSPTPEDKPAGSWC